jgi:hypothetical protein
MKKVSMADNQTTISDFLKTKTEETKLQQNSSKNEVAKSSTINVESGSNDDVIITDVKEQVVTHFRKILYSQ